MKVAVILSGCGYLDGAEIRESVLTLLYLEQEGMEYALFAPDIEQHHVVNHLSGEAVPHKRNVLLESARIARGDIHPLTSLDSKDFDALILPGGFGVAKQCSDIAFKGKDACVRQDMAQIIMAFFSANKPIGAMCIAPAMVVSALTSKARVTVTLGKDTEGLIEGLGGIHQNASTCEIVIDPQYPIISCAAYMQESPLLEVAKGIESLVKAVSTRCQ